MSRSIGVRTRRELIARTLALIDKNPDITVKKLIALAGYTIGLTNKKCREYLEILEQIGKIEPTERGFKIKKS